MNLTFGGEDIDISFDEDEFMDFWKDFEKFEKNKHKAEKKVHKQFEKDLKEAYKTTLAKIYLDFGETFTPIAEAYYEYI